MGVHSDDAVSGVVGGSVAATVPTWFCL